MFSFFGAISDEDKAEFERCITALWDDYKIIQVKESQISDITELLKGFELLKGWDAVTLAQVCLFSKNNHQAQYCVPVMDKNAKRVGSKGQITYSHINEAYQLFLLNLETDLGHILIRPERISDKISELFGNIDIDFKFHPKFSKKYFALSKSPEDESTFRKNVKGNILDTVAEYDGLRIEINNKKMIVMTDKRIDARDSVKLAEFVFKVT